MSSAAQMIAGQPVFEAIESFLEESVGSDIQLVAIQPDGPAEAAWFGEEADKAAAWALSKNQQGKNLYWTVNLAPKMWKKPEEKQILAARFLHVDVDTDCETALAQLRAGEIVSAPAFIISSGNGIQAFWRLDAPAENLASIKDLNRRIEHVFGGDHCHNLDRLMRLPGTVNHPNAKKRAAGRVPVLASILDEDEGNTVDPEEMRLRLPPAPPKPSDDRQKVKLSEVRSYGLQELNINGLNPLFVMITAPENTNRSEDVFAVACEMVRQRFTDEEIAGVLLNPELGISEHCFDQSDPRRAAKRAIGKARALVAQAAAAPPEKGAPAYLSGISAAALMQKEFQPVNYVIPGLIAEGATLFGGPPKVGKSWMAYDFAIALSSGRPVFGNIAISQGDVLYLALEDSQRRLKSRLIKKGVTAPERLTLCTDWPRLDQGCIDELEAWAASVERPTLIIIDVLKMVRGATGRNESIYDADYRALTGLAAFARNRGLAVIIVHHTRKSAAEDPLESLSGTNGLTGAADTVMVLKRDIGTDRCILYVRGRDVEEAEKAVRFNRDNGTWQLLGDADEVGRTDERETILDVLRKDANPLSARDICDVLGKNYDAVRKCLARMAVAQEVRKVGRGLYACPSSPNVPSTPKPDNRTHGTGDVSEIFPHGNPAFRAIHDSRPLF